VRAPVQDHRLREGLQRRAGGLLRRVREEAAVVDELLVPVMNQTFPGYMACRCGKHWWNVTQARWVTMTLRGDVPVPLPTPHCCHASDEQCACVRYPGKASSQG